MKKKLISNLQEFEAWRSEQIEEYKDCYSPALNSTQKMDIPKYFPVIIVYDDFNDADDGLYFFYEFVYFNEFEK